jgi:hypothetical protein
MSVNVAVTVFWLSRVTEHVPVPVQSPDQPANAEPAEAVAVRTTPVPALNGLEPAPLMPDGALETAPLPVPAIATTREYWTGSSWKLTLFSVPETAVTLVDADVR